MKLANPEIKFFKEFIKYFTPKHFKDIKHDRFRYCWEPCYYDCPMRVKCLRVFDATGPNLNSKDLEIIKEKFPEYFI